MMRIVSGLIAGGLAGVAALACSQLVSKATAQHFVPVTPEMLAAYVLCGAAIGLVVTLVHAGWRRSSEALPALWVGAISMGLLYTAPIVFRVSTVLFYRGFSDTAQIGGAVLALVGYGAWIALLAIATGPKHAWLAFVLAALSSQITIIVNQDVFLSPFAGGALLADAAVIAAAGVVAMMCRGPAWLQMATGGLAAAGAIGLVAMPSGPSRPPVPVVAASPDRPNVVFVLIDTLRADVFEQVLAETEEGRGLVEVLRGSASFRQALSAAPWTPPSMGSILTGRYPAEHGFEQPARPTERSPIPPLRPLSPSVRTLPQDLQDRGYATEAVMANTLLSGSTGIGRGFDHYDVLACPASELPFTNVLASAGLLSCPYYEDARAVSRAAERHAARLEASGSPFFLWIQYMDPHEPLDTTRALTPDPVGDRLPELERSYRNAVRYVAQELASTLAAFEQRPWWRQTVLIVTSDHGEMLPSDGREEIVPGLDGKPRTYGHGHALYEELVHVPLVIRPPGGLPEDRSVDVLTSHVDLRATLSDLLGLGLTRVAPERYSLAPWLLPEPATSGVPARSEAYLSSNYLGPPQAAIRTDQLKLIFYPEGEQEPELYRLADDPGERVNRAGEEPDRLAWAIATIDELRATLQPGSESHDVQMTGEMRERLKALGYIR